MALAFAKKTFSYPICLDAGKAFQQYGVRGIPVTYLINRDGKITGRHVGYGEGMEKQLEDEATRLLAGKTTSRE